METSETCETFINLHQHAGWRPDRTRRTSVFVWKQHWKSKGNNRRNMLSKNVAHNFPTCRVTFKRQVNSSTTGQHTSEVIIRVAWSECYASIKRNTMAKELSCIMSADMRHHLLTLSYRSLRYNKCRLDPEPQQSWSHETEIKWFIIAGLDREDSLRVWVKQCPICHFFGTDSCIASYLDHVEKAYKPGNPCWTLEVLCKLGRSLARHYSVSLTLNQ